MCQNLSMMYDTLASYYDALVKDEEASHSWIEWMKPYITGNDVLELACGSGEITILASRIAEHMSAMDLSEKMVEQARAKQGSDAVDFSVGDMRNLEGYGLYDAIFCVCDSINYLTELSDLTKLAGQCAKHLKPGGYFLFDTHSLDRLEEFSYEYNETGQFEDGMQIQWSIMSEDEFIYQDFAFYYPDGHMELEYHLQRVFMPSQISAAFEPYFKLEDLKTDFAAPGIEEGEKYFYIWKKREI